MQHGHRRTAQQRGKPAVKGANLHGAPARQHQAVQASQLAAQLGAGLGAFLAGNAAHDEFLAQRFVVGAGEFFQPLVEALAHFASGFFGEGDGEDFMRAHQLAGRAVGVIGRVRTVEQGAHDARDQHPGFARPSAGFNGDAATRVAGDGVKRLGTDGLAVAGVSGGGHGWSPFQKSLRHRPRAAQ